MTIIYDVCFSGKPQIGLPSFTDTVTLTLMEKNNPARDPSEFAEVVRKALHDWYGYCRIALIKEE